MDLFETQADTRRCMKCDVIKPGDDFYKHANGSIRHECKPCMNAKARARHKLASKKPGFSRDKYLKRYGITHADYERILKAQGGVCAICESTETKKWDHFSVDHNHETGEVRGLLCATCNTGLGQFQDAPDLLIKAANYLTLRGHYGE